MLFILPLGAATAAALLAGGTVWPIAETKFRLPALLFLGVAAQMFVPLAQEPIAIALVTVSMVAALAFLSLNRSLPGLMLVTIGVACNALVVLLNQGMPVSVRAAEWLGTGLPGGARHNASVGDSQLAWLGDVLPLPGFQVVVSLGDLLMIAGLCVFVYRTMTRARAES